MSRIVTESAKMRPYYKTAEDYPSLLLDDTHALCNARDFESLLEYSLHLPTGKYLGKVWKCRNWRESGLPGDWLLVEYVPCDLPGQIGIKWRELEVVE